MRRRLPFLLALLVMVPGTLALAGEPIKIGEINSYSRVPQFLDPYKKGWEMAVDEINAAGGVLGRKLVVISRDDGGKPDVAERHATELVQNEKVSLLAGTFLSHIGLAVSSFAKRNKVLFVAAEPLSDAITWSKGHRYTFRLRPNTYEQCVMLAREAAKLPAKRWATIAPNYEYGQSAVRAFKEVLSKLRPDVEWVEEQWPALFKLDAGSTVQALARARPDAIFNVTFGSDLAKFVREGTTRGLFRNRSVVSLLTGEPEYLDPLKDEAPEGWIVTGYPWYAIQDPAHKKFVADYEKRYNDYPRVGSLVGYLTFKAIAAAIAKAGTTGTEALVDAMEGLEFDSPVGRIKFRKIDHQSTLGAWVGKIKYDPKMGRGILVDWKYVDGSEVLPGPEWVAKVRPKE
ncbi:ABC transporter substrate-binding protein [Deferrisoma camini]|uniref:ABC transporter substrate-binding protein n=1 Tax=Deferrisoma camini TaxID=1035120 RepID=UPI00046D460C|nr:ABC transporter substrate-binding protein [Deferrisoma camini]